MVIWNSVSRIRKEGFHVSFYHLLTRQLNCLCFRYILHKVGEVIMVTIVFGYFGGASRGELFSSYSDTEHVVNTYHTRAV